MALPAVAAVGALTSGIAPITPAMPAGLAVNHVLIMQITSNPSGLPATIANAAGGTWDPIGGFGGSFSNSGVRGTWFVSRYNGTQTAPLLSDTGGMQAARIVAYSGCITTGSPINNHDGGAPTFAEATSTIPGFTTSSNDCLIVDCIVAEGPDADGTGLFGTWTNAALSTPTEVFDDSTSAGLGGSLAMQAGGLHTAGATGTTSVVHANVRVAYKKIALTPAVLSFLRFDKNARMQPVINGVTRFMRGIYDAEIPAFNDWAAFVVTRNYARYNFDFVIHPQNGTVGNSLRYANALQPLGMFVWTTGNFFGNFTIAPEDFIPATSGYDVYNNNTYTIPPGGAAPFRDQWVANAGAAGTYIADEPAYVATGWYFTQGSELVVNGTFTTTLASWTNDGSTAATWSSQQASFTPGAQLRQTIAVTPVVQPSDAYRIQFAVGGAFRPRVTVVSNAVTLYDSGANPTAGTKEAIIRPTGTTLEIKAVANAGGAGVWDTVSLFSIGGDPDTTPVTNTYVPTTRGRDNMVMLHNSSKSFMPDMPTFSTFINDNVTQWRDWSPFAIGDYLGCDIYTIGQAPEIHPDNGTGTPSTYGYMNFSVAEAVALARYYCPLYDRVPHVVLQTNKFGGSSRFQTLSETWSHMVIGVAELRGVGAIIWWALGTQDGGLDQRPFQISSGNGTQTVFAAPNHFTEQAVDVEVQINGVVQPQSAYTVQNVQSQETTPLIRSGNFWVLQNPPTVTMTTAPANGASVVVTTWRWPQTRRNAMKDLLDSMTETLASLESIMIQPSNPALLTANSTGQADFRAWRIPYCNTLASQAADRPTWLFGATTRYQVERDALSQPVPDYWASLHMMDGQAVFGNVRTTCWESGNIGIVAAYNQHPDAQPSVSFQWHTTITLIEVLGENRTIPVNGGTGWTDTFGGASSLRQGPFNQGHLYRLTLGTGIPLNHYTMTADPSTYAVTGTAAVLTQLAGPTLVGFVWRR